MIVKNEPKTSGHRVEHLQKHIFFLGFCLCYCCCCRRLFPHADPFVITFFSVIFKHITCSFDLNTPCIRFTSRNRELFGLVAIFMFAQILKNPFHFICKSSFVYASAMRSWCRFTLSLVFASVIQCHCVSLNRRDQKTFFLFHKYFTVLMIIITVLVASAKHVIPSNNRT